jgi:hypothetical protein
MFAMAATAGLRLRNRAGEEIRAPDTIYDTDCDRDGSEANQSRLKLSKLLRRIVRV